MRRNQGTQIRRIHVRLNNVLSTYNAHTTLDTTGDRCSLSTICFNDNDTLLSCGSISIRATGSAVYRVRATNILANRTSGVLHNAVSFEQNTGQNINRRDRSILLFDASTHGHATPLVLYNRRRIRNRRTTSVNHLSRRGLCCLHSHNLDRTRTHHLVISTHFTPTLSGVPLRALQSRMHTRTTEELSGSTR